VLAETFTRDLPPADGRWSGRLLETDSQNTPGGLRPSVYIAWRR
jgi:hypothetical protein